MKKTILIVLFLYSTISISQTITIQSDKLAIQARNEIIAKAVEEATKKAEEISILQALALGPRTSAIQQAQAAATTQTRISTTAMSDMEAIETAYGTKKEGISFGLSLGFNSLLSNHKNALISPIDNKLIITNNQSTSFVISSIISFPISFKYGESANFRRQLDKNGKPIGKAYIDSQWSVLAIVNIAQFNDAVSNTVFNQKISGGLGLSYNFTPTLSVGASLELTSVIQPRDFLIDLNDQEIMVNNEVVKSLDTSNSIFFKEEYLPSMSIKLIYKIL